MEEEPIKTEVKRNEDGTFADGTIAGPGRPKGKTLKEYAREYFMLKSDEDKRKYIEELEQKKPGFAWQMGEGNPHNTEDITSKGEKIIPIYGGHSVQRHNSDQENIPTTPENPSSGGGDIGQ